VLPLTMPGDASKGRRRRRLLLLPPSPSPLRPRPRVCTLLRVPKSLLLLPRRLGTEARAKSVSLGLMVTPYL
jgi:hypothetical protein